MEKAIPSFQYKPLVFIPKPKTSDEKEERGNTNGEGPLCIRAKEKRNPQTLEREG
jgi:hypothetical protein